MAFTAVPVYTSAPLRKVFDIVQGSSNDSGAIVITHGIDFSDAVGSAGVNNLLTVTIMQLASTGVLPVVVSSANSTAVTLYITASSGAGSVGWGTSNGCLRVEIQRVHSVQG